MKYALSMGENSHYRDEDETPTPTGNYETAQEAIMAAMALVDRDLESFHRPGQTADELFTQYTHFGVDPWIVTDDPYCSFSAWDYARQRCRVLCE